MKPHGEPSQDWFFYNGRWNIALDSYLIKRLVEREEECKPVAPADLSHAYICAMEALNKELVANITYDDVLDRVNFLRKRYNCFKKLACRMETKWKALNNRVTTNDKVWKIIFQEDDFTRAYYKNGDPLWFKLCHLFGYNDTKKEASPTEIIIGQSTYGFAESTTNKNIDSIEEEVSSHVVKPPTARKLVFDDTGESSGGPSTAKTPHLRYVWPPMERRSMFPPANAFPRKPKIGDCKEGGVEHSSCESCSPFK